MTAQLDELCRRHGISLAELAARSGLEQTRVEAIVSGRWTPSPADRQRIADVFAIPVDQIAWGHKTPIQHIYGHGPT